MDERLEPKKRRVGSDKAASRRRNRGNRTADDTIGSSETPRVDPIPTIIGSLFRAARRDQSLSQDQVAAMTDAQLGQVSRTTISDIERGRSLPGLEALVSLSRVLHVEPTEIFERVDLARRSPLDLTGLTLAALRNRADELFWSGDYRGALEACDALLDHLQLDPPQDEDERRKLRARIEIDRALALWRCSALKAALACALRAVEIAEGLGRFQAEAYMVLASVLSHEGLSVLARVAADQAVELSQGADPLLRGRALSQRGNVLYRAGHASKARQAFLAARKLLKETEQYQERIKVEGNLGACLLELKQRGPARERFRTAVDLARKYHVRAAEALLARRAWPHGPRRWKVRRCGRSRGSIVADCKTGRAQPYDLPRRVATALGRSCARPRSA